MLVGDFCIEGQEQIIYMVLKCQYLSGDVETRLNFSPKFVEVCLVLCDWFCLFVTTLRKSVHRMIAWEINCCYSI